MSFWCDPVENGSQVHHEYFSSVAISKNICYLNKTGQKVTRERCDRFVADKESYPVDFIYNNKKKVSVWACPC